MNFDCWNDADGHHTWPSSSCSFDNIDDVFINFRYFKIKSTISNTYCSRSSYIRI